MPLDRAQASSEGQALLLVDRYLGNSPQLILHRILDRDDLVFGRLDLRQAGVQSGRLTRAGRTGDQDHAVRLVNRIAEIGKRLLLESELRHVELQIRLV